MRQGTTRRKRGAPMRQEDEIFRTRDSRRRFSPTENSHAALHPVSDVTRAYQSDSSSKQPSLSAAPNFQTRILPSPMSIYRDWSVHIRSVN